jgi:hypothetical protein
MQVQMKCLIIIVPGKGWSILYPETVIEYFLFYISSTRTQRALQDSVHLTFINVLKYILVEFTPLCHSPLSSLPHSWNVFNRYHSYTLSFLPPLHNGTYSADRTRLAFLFSGFVKKNGNFSLFKIGIQVFHLDISTYICIISQNGLPSPFFSFLP